jgi:hypothetical protein
VRGSTNPKRLKKEREKAGEKGWKKSRKIAEHYYQNNKDVGEKVESKIGKMSELYTTLF